MAAFHVFNFSCHKVMLDLDLEYDSSQTEKLNLTIGKLKGSFLFSVNFNLIFSIIAK